MVLGQSDGAPALQRSAAEILAAAAAIGDAAFAQALLRRVVEAMAGTANPVRCRTSPYSTYIYLLTFTCTCRQQASPTLHSTRSGRQVVPSSDSPDSLQTHTSGVAAQAVGTDAGCRRNTPHQGRHGDAHLGRLHSGHHARHRAVDCECGAAHVAGAQPAADCQCGRAVLRPICAGEHWRLGTLKMQQHV